MDILQSLVAAPKSFKLSSIQVCRACKTRAMGGAMNAGPADGIWQTCVVQEQCYFEVRKMGGCFESIEVSYVRFLA